MRSESKVSRPLVFLEFLDQAFLCRRVYIERFGEVVLDHSIFRCHFVERSVEIGSLHAKKGFRNLPVAAPLDERVDLGLIGPQDVQIALQVILHHDVPAGAHQRKESSRGPTGSVLSGGAVEQGRQIGIISQRHEQAAIRCLRARQRDKGTKAISASVKLCFRDPKNIGPFIAIVL